MSLYSFSGDFKRLGPSMLFQPLEPSINIWSFFEVDPSKEFYPGVLAEPYTDPSTGKALVRPATDASKVIGVFWNSYNLSGGLYTQKAETVVPSAIDSAGLTFTLTLSVPRIKDVPFISIYNVAAGEWVYSNGELDPAGTGKYTGISVDAVNGKVTITVNDAANLPSDGDNFDVVFYYKNPYFDAKLTTIVPENRVSIWSGSMADTMVYIPADYAAGDALTIDTTYGVLKKAASGDTVVGIVVVPPFDEFGRMRVKFSF